jgi:uncharacterized protein YcbK (DUF882 family)
MTTASSLDYFKALPWVAILLLAAGFLLVRPDSAAAQKRRFYYSGDGEIHVSSEKYDRVFDGRYRDGPDRYKSMALAQIDRVFGVPGGIQGPVISLRLIEFLDYLEDQYNPGAEIEIISGYRDPTYNTGLRNKGRLAAKASLHQYGMAADIQIHGVSSKRIWDGIKALGFGGAGYYQGRSVHVDVGPARSWDQNTSGVGTGISDDNKLIGMVTDFDLYRHGQKIVMRFIRMTAFPVGVRPRFYLEARAGPGGSPIPFRPSFAVEATGECPEFTSIEQMDGVRWRLPKNLTPGRYRIRATFCDNPYAKMPAEVFTPEFDIIGPH